MSPIWKIVVCLAVIVAVVAALSSSRRPGQAPVKPSSSTARSSASASADRPLMPLAVGNRWSYLEKRKDPKTGDPVEVPVAWVVSGEAREGFRVTEERDGKAVNTFTLVPAPDGTRLFEFESQAQPMLLLPPKLAAGDAWDLKDTMRAKVVRDTSIEAAGKPTDCFEIRFERFYGKDWTDDPGWFEDGTIWVAPGMGIIGKDLTRAVRPPARDRSTPRQVWGAVGTTWKLDRLELK